MVGSLEEGAFNFFLNRTHSAFAGLIPTSQELAHLDYQNQIILSSSWIQSIIHSSAKAKEICEKLKKAVSLDS